MFSQHNNDQQTLATLETNTLTTDSTQATELATCSASMQRCYHDPRLEDQNAMATVNQMQHLMESKDALDSQKGDVATWSNGNTESRHSATNTRTTKPALRCFTSHNNHERHRQWTFSRPSRNPAIP